VRQLPRQLRLRFRLSEPRSRTGQPQFHVSALFSADLNEILLPLIVGPHQTALLTTLGASRVARAFLVYVLPHYLGAPAGRRPRSSHPAVTAFPDNVVGSTCTSSFSRPVQRSLALRPAHSRGHLYVTCYTEGFSHFVTSMTAPVASGWSVWPGGACTHWKAPPCHGRPRAAITEA
jgi:hypothetical protein